MAAEPKDLISIDEKVLGGQPVFRGTRVPVESLFWHLEDGATVDDFINDFPSVSKKQVIGVLAIMGDLFTAEKIRKLYEAAA